MKLLFTFITVIFITNASLAQLTPGSYIVGGNLGLGYNKTPAPSGNSNSQSFSARINPSIGKFISEKYVLHGGVGYSLRTRRSELEQPLGNYISRNNEHSFSLNFGVTRYFPVADRLYVTLGTSISPTFSTLHEESGYPNNISSDNRSTLSAGISVAPGLTYFINKKWMLNSSIGVASYRMNYNMETEKLGHNMYLNLRANAFTVGVRYILGSGTSE